jgi:FkbM family methyltransferase
MNNVVFNYQKYQKYHKAIEALPKPVNVVIIGANDGVHVDPLYSFIKQNPKDYRVFLIEPIASLHKELLDNYKEFPQARSLAVAISPGSVVKLYVPLFQSFLSSENPNHLLKHNYLGNGTYATRDYIENLGMYVPGMTLKQAMQYYPEMDRIDVLQVDVEGFEAEVLKVS